MGISARFALLFFTIFSLQIATNSAHAQVKITSVVGASNFIESSGTSNPIIYGGIAGSSSPSCDGLSSTAMCNNCTGTEACNERRIHPALRLRINFEVTGDLTGVPRLTHGTALDEVDGVTGTTSTLSKGGTGFLETTWGDVCSELTGDPNCDLIELSGSLQVSIGTVTPPATGSYSTITVKIFRPDDPTSNDDITCGLSPEQDGICTFKAYPGDEKIYLEDLDDEGSYPDVDNVPFQFLRVFFSTVGFDDVNYATQDSADLDVEDDGAVSPEKIDGLENEVRYYFKTAMVDAAYNVAFLTSDAQIDSECGGDHDNPDLNICPHTATPSNVLGLLEKDFNCFVTSAAYGSGMAGKVQDFREFRNRFLVPYNWGRSFIFYYYNVGPKAARWMWEHPWSKPVVRAALWPVWLYAVIANGAGIFIANITFFLIFALVAYSIYSLRTRQASVKVRRRDK